uniref:Secreted protein n=1 Tax=Panagrellus redivivus TaxID=6233 RepID=A0A7E4V9Q9_PANRE
MKSILFLTLLSIVFLPSGKPTPYLCPSNPLLQYPQSSATCVNPSKAKPIAMRPAALEWLVSNAPEKSTARFASKRCAKSVEILFPPPRNPPVVKASCGKAISAQNASVAVIGAMAPPPSLRCPQALWACCFLLRFWYDSCVHNNS